jgi:enolase
VAKYNRLLAIEAELGASATYGCAVKKQEARKQPLGV